MLRFLRKLQRFVFHAESDQWLRIARIGLGLQTVLYCLTLRSSWRFFFGEHGAGALGREVSEAMMHARDVFVPLLRWISVGLSSLGISEDNSLKLVWLILLVAGCLLIVGLFCRVSAVVAWFLHLCLAKSGSFSAYGVDSMMTMGLFYLMLAPLPDLLSLDWCLTKPKPADPAMLGFFRRALQVHLCFIYFFGGLTKMLGSGWWNGESVWRALTRPPFNHLPPELLVRGQAFLPALGISVWLIELLYVVFIWPRRTRTVWLGLVLALHLGIALTMGLYLFSLVLIVLNLAAFGPDWKPARPALAVAS